MRAKSSCCPPGTQPEPGTLYEFHYPAKDPRVLGIGLAATRDLISFLRYETTDAKGTANPARPGVRHALAFGISQSGRFLRDYVKDGFNQDESTRKVFDGMLAHTAGAGGVFLNYEFGQPNRTGTQHEDHAFPENEFPFSTALMIDPVTNRAGSAAARRRLRPAVDGDQHLDRVLAEGRVTARHRPARQ